jgi:hypothetical protein
MHSAVRNALSWFGMVCYVRFVVKPLRDPPKDSSPLMPLVSATQIPLRLKMHSDWCRSV